MSLEIRYWKGRLGNNISQIKNLLKYGIFYNMNIIMPKHNFFKSKNIIINNKNKNKKDLTYIDSGNKKKNQFFNDKYIKTELKPNFIDNVDIKTVNKFLNDNFIIKSNLKYDDKTLIIYIRSGDLFPLDRNKKVHPKYRCPPLYYYDTIIKQNKNKYNKYILVAEDDRNIVIKKLLRKYKFIEWKQRSLEEDLEIILGASHIVSCVGTFISSLSWVSLNMKKIYYPGSSTKKQYYPEIKLEKIKLPNFLEKMGRWEYSDRQLKLLKTYKP